MGFPSRLWVLDRNEEKALKLFSTLFKLDPERAWRILADESAHITHLELQRVADKKQIALEKVSSIRG